MRNLVFAVAVAAAFAVPQRTVHAREPAPAVKPTATSRPAAPAIEQLKAATQPVFRPGSSLIPLSIWGPELPLDVRIELADHWGYCLQFGRLRPELVQALADPKSVTSQVCALAKADPGKYPLDVITAPAFSVRDYEKKLPDDAWTHDADGKLPEGKRIWSPEAPDAAFTTIADYEVNMLGEVLKRAPIAVLTNGGEYALSVLGHHLKYWQKDPKIVKARGERDWWEYISDRKAHQELIITRRLQELVPQRKLYIYYFTEAPSFRMRWGGWKDWCWDYKHFRPASDMPNTSIYWRPGEECWTGKYDLLTHALNSTAQQIAANDKWSYNWMSPGWVVKEAKQPWMSDRARYLGYLKCYYTAGMIGGVAGYFAYDSEDNWIWQLMELGQVQALFSHLDSFVRQSDLVPGPNKHVWSKDFPAYELPTGQENVRVLARKHQQRPEWLLTAWAADGKQRNVEVEVPTLGKVALDARGTGAVYHAILRDDQPILTLIDKDGDDPTWAMAATFELK